MKSCTFRNLVLQAILVAIVLGCSRPAAPPLRDFDTIDLLIKDVSAFPGGWEVSAPAHAKRVFLRENIGGARIQFGYPWAGHAWHEISRFRNIQDAAVAYRDQDYYPGAKSRWETPKELSYQSPIANQFRVACRPNPRATECVTMAQYDEFVSAFNINADSYAFTFSDLERVLRAIDERMARVLGKPLPSSGTPP